MFDGWNLFLLVWFPYDPYNCYWSLKKLTLRLRDHVEIVAFSDLNDLSDRNDRDRLDKIIMFYLSDRDRHDRCHR